MNITECRVNPVENQGRTVGYATLAIDNAVVITGIRLRQADSGLVVEFPQRQKKNGEYETMVRPMSKDAYREVFTAVKAAYEEAVEKKKKQQIVGEMVEEGRRIHEEKAAAGGSGYSNGGYENQRYHGNGGNGYHGSNYGSGGYRSRN